MRFIAGRSFSRCSWLLLATLGLSFGSAPADARWGRGSYRAYQQVMKKQMQYMQKQQQEYEKQVKAEQEAFMKRFDTNHNGKIDGKEKGPAQKYLRQIELGKDPDKALKNMGRRTSSTATKKSSEKRRPAAAK